MADESTEAFKHAARAYYKSTDFDERIKELERRYISESIRRNGGMIVFITKLLFERRIDFKVRF